MMILLYYVNLFLVLVGFNRFIISERIDSVVVRRVNVEFGYREWSRNWNSYDLKVCNGIGFSNIMVIYLLIKIKILVKD